MRRFQVNINNAAVDVVINFYSQRRYAEKIGSNDVNGTILGLRTGISVTEDGNAHLEWEFVDRIVAYVFEGIVEAARIDKKEIPFAIEDVYQLFDNMDELSKVLVEVIGALPVSDEKQAHEGEPSGNPQSPPTAD